MKVIHQARVKKVGLLRTYNAIRCDTCSAEQVMCEYFLDGNVLPDGWTRTHVKDRGFSIQKDHCAACSKASAA